MKEIYKPLTGQRFSKNGWNNRRLWSMRTENM